MLSLKQDMQEGNGKPGGRYGQKWTRGGERGGLKGNGRLGVGKSRR